MIHLPERDLDILTKKDMFASSISFFFEIPPGISLQIPWKVYSVMPLRNHKEFFFEVFWDFSRTAFRFFFFNQFLPEFLQEYFWESSTNSREITNLGVLREVFEEIIPATWTFSSSFHKEFNSDVSFKIPFEVSTSIPSWVRDHDVQSNLFCNLTLKFLQELFLRFTQIFLLKFFQRFHRKFLLEFSQYYLLKSHQKCILEFFQKFYWHSIRSSFWHYSRNHFKNRSNISPGVLLGFRMFFLLWNCYRSSFWYSFRSSFWNFDQGFF